MARGERKRHCMLSICLIRLSRSDHKWTGDVEKIQPQAIYDELVKRNTHEIALYLYAKKAAQLHQCPCVCTKDQEGSNERVGKSARTACNCGQYPRSLVDQIEALGREFSGMIEDSAVRQV